MSRFKYLKIQAIRRKLNSQANALTKGAAYGEYAKNNNWSVKEDSAEEEEEKFREVNMVDISN